VEVQVGGPRRGEAAVGPREEECPAEASAGESAAGQLVAEGDRKGKCRARRCGA